MQSKLKFYFSHLQERLWVRPLLVCLGSVLVAWLANKSDRIVSFEHVPDISSSSLEDLLKIIAASMLVIATLAVGSMVAAYTSAGSSATPRAFPLIVSDDVSQNALSTFLGAFIFSIVAFIFLTNGFYGVEGRFTLFLLCLVVLSIVILIFLRWVDQIARLGRLGSVIEKVEHSTKAAIINRLSHPYLKASPPTTDFVSHYSVFPESVGHVQQVDIALLDQIAGDLGARIRVETPIGSFAAPHRPLATLNLGAISTKIIHRIQNAFVIGADRKFNGDPRFGLVVLSEIAGKALSPAINDPGTATQVLGVMVRLFSVWNSSLNEREPNNVLYDRVEVAPIAIEDLFEDCFTSISRDGAGMIEVGIRLQEAFRAIASLGNPEMREQAVRCSMIAYKRAESKLDIEEDLKAIKSAVDHHESGPAEVIGGRESHVTARTVSGQSSSSRS